MHAPEQPVSQFGETAFTRKKQRSEKIARGIFALMVACIVIPLFLIVGYLIKEGVSLINWEFLTTNPIGGMRKGGIWSALLGTFWLVIVSLCISAPIGVLAAVYLNEYAKDNWFNRVVNLAVVNLASVPRQFREACWNVGATKWQTIWRIVLPNSVSGILTGVILQVSRTAGETAPIMFTGAVFYRRIEEGNLFAYGLNDQCMALSMHLFTVTTQVTNAPHALPFAIATVLLGLVLFVNLTAIIFRSWLRGRKKW